MLICFIEDFIVIKLILIFNVDIIILWDNIYYESFFEFVIVLFLNVFVNFCILVFCLNLISWRGKFKIMICISIIVEGMGVGVKCKIKFVGEY